MANMDYLVNTGFCQGFLSGDVYTPKMGVAIITVATRAERKNPKTGKKDYFNLNFKVFGEEADILAMSAVPGSKVFVQYHLKAGMKTRKENGIAVFLEDYIADRVLVKIVDSEYKVPYLNRGFLEATFVDVHEQPGSKGIYVMSTMFQNEEDTKKSFFDFIVFGPEGEKVKEHFVKNQKIIVEYKLEKYRSVDSHGKPTFVTNRIVERVR